MQPRSASIESAADRRSHAIALSSALLAVPLLIAHPAAATLLLTASVVGAAVLLERWPVSRMATREGPRQAPSLALVRTPSSQVCFRWELVERDGRRSLEMRWR